MNPADESTSKEMIAYIDSVLAQRDERDARMRANPRNWLSLVGLFPLSEGENRIDSADSNQATLPGNIPAYAGTFKLQGESVELIAPPGSGFRLNGVEPQARPLHTDVDGEPDILQLGSLDMMIIKRGGRAFLRAWDLDSPRSRDFSGFVYYPVDPNYRITANYLPYNEPRMLTIEDAIGTPHETQFPGEARFTLNGIPCRLLGEQDDDELLFSFTDLTRADTTYPGGRRLTVPLPQSNTFILDFNLTINWPCAYTPYATCPLPPFENRLSVRIEAGEKRYPY